MAIVELKRLCDAENTERRTINLIKQNVHSKITCLFLNQLFSLCPYRHNAAFFTGKKVDIWDKTKYTVSKRKIRCQMKEIERAREFKLLSVIEQGKSISSC